MAEAVRFVGVRLKERSQWSSMRFTRCHHRLLLKQMSCVLITMVLR